MGTAATCRDKSHGDWAPAGGWGQIVPLSEQVRSFSSRAKSAYLKTLTTSKTGFKHSASHKSHPWYPACGWGSGPLLTPPVPSLVTPASTSTP